MIREKTYENDLLLPSIVNIIVKDKRIKPFWNNKIQELSNQLFREKDTISYFSLTYIF